MRFPFLASLSLTLTALGLAPVLPAADWQPTTTELIATEKPGFGKLCGVLVDHATGDVTVDLSDKGLYRSTDQGKTWQRTGPHGPRGRTERPGCMLLDPTGKSQRLVAALVYGSPIAVSPDAGATWKFLNAQSSHVDWCAVDWIDPGMPFVLALKHESGDLLIASRDGGQSFQDVGKGYGPAWVFDQTTAVVALAKSANHSRPGLLRTTDGGKTFRPCGDSWARSLPQWHEGTLYWLVDGGLITTTDQGQTWKKIAAVKDGRYGPVFGKDSRHLFVLTGAGIIESTDGGTTWSTPLALPREIADAGPLTWIEYDPQHDILYAMKMGSDLFRLTRSPGRKE